jgi:hypothetical protein
VKYVCSLYYIDTVLYSNDYDMPHTVYLGGIPMDKTRYSSLIMEKVVFLKNNSCFIESVSQNFSNLTFSSFPK